MVVFAGVMKPVDSPISADHVGSGNRSQGRYEAIPYTARAFRLYCVARRGIVHVNAWFSYPPLSSPRRRITPPGSSNASVE